MESARKVSEQLGHKRICLKSDNEPAVLALKEAVRRESEWEIVSEEAPVKDNQSSGMVENARRAISGC